MYVKNPSNQSFRSFSVEAVFVNLCGTSRTGSCIFDKNYYIHI